MGNNLTDDQKRAAFLREVDPQLQAWLGDLSRNGIDRSVRMGSPLNESARVSSGYGRRNGGAIGHGEGTPPPTSVHEAIDFTSQHSSAGRDVMVNALVGGGACIVGGRPGTRFGPKCDDWWCRWAYLFHRTFQSRYVSGARWPADWS